MIDATLERHLGDAKELQGLWRNFRDYFVAATRQEPVDEAKEIHFLKIKSRIAMLHDTYLDTITSGQKIAQNIITLVGRSITLKHVSELSIAESKKFEIEWHESYLQIEETIGQLEEERERLSQVSVAKYRMNNFKARVKNSIAVTLHSTVFRLAVVALILIGILVGLVVFNVVDKMYENPRTSEIALKVESFIRILQPDLEYREMNHFIDRYLQLPGNKPNDFSRINRVGGNKRNAAAKTNWKDDEGSFTAEEDLMAVDADGKALVKYDKLELLADKGAFQPIGIDLFMFEESKQAKDIMKRFGKFREANGQFARSDPPGNSHSFFRKANVLVVMDGANFGGRDWLRKNHFKYRIERD